MADMQPSMDFAWGPIRYPLLRPEDEGVWTLVLGETDDPIGVVWTNYSDSAGVMWVFQEKPIENLLKHFFEAATAGTSAGDAYNAAELVPGVRLGGEFTGKLQGVIDELAAISDDLS